MPFDDGVPGIDSNAIFASAGRAEQMARAWKAYRGDLPAPLKIQTGQPNDNVLSNRCGPIVDKGVSFLFGQVLKLSVEGNDAAAQDYLTRAWGDDDSMMTLLAKLATNGAVCGHAFVKLLPAVKKGDTPRIVLLDPQTVTVTTDPDDCDVVRAYTITWQGQDAVTGQPAQRREISTRLDPDGRAGTGGGDDDTWVIASWTQRAGTWQRDGDPVAWPHPWAPIVDCQNLPNPNEYWGTPDLTPDLIEANRVLNFVQSNISRIIKIHAHPWIWGRGFSANQINMTPGQVIILPSERSELMALNAHGDLPASMNFAGNLRSDMDEQSRVPAVALGRLTDLPKGNISGVALQLLFQPLLEKTIMKQRLYGKLIREISKRLLALGGFDYHTHIDLHWQNLLPVDDLAAAQTAMALQHLGVSTQTILSQLGYNPDEEAERTARESAATLTKFNQGQGMPPVLPSVGPPQEPMPQDDRGANE